MKGTILDIKELKIRARKNHIKITDHPYYQCLSRQNGNIYENYVNESKHQQKKKTGDWHGYNRLVQKIKEEGFIYKKDDTLLIKYKHDDWYVTHGRHRACILRYLYGKKIKFVLKKLHNKNHTFYVKNIILY